MSLAAWGVAFAILGILITLSNVLGFVVGLPILVTGILLFIVGLVIALVSWPVKAIWRTRRHA
ncbi:MAG TPA: hypothetical protein VM889_01690 [Candidatus Thermoplasmatota archaeon]|nr:hypothetical protein [Candidatus Thermoplasmatota archaeon]